MGISRRLHATGLEIKEEEYNVYNRKKLGEKELGQSFLGPEYLDPIVVENFRAQTLITRSEDIVNIEISANKAKEKKIPKPDSGME